MSGIPKFERQGVALTDPLTAGGIRLPVSTQLPKLNSAIGFAMTEKWINREAELFALPRHHVYGIMEKKRADFAGRFRHENARMRLAPHQYRERSNVILMRVSDKNGVDCLALDRLPIRQRILAHLSGMHPAVENQPRASPLEVVRVGADLSMSSEIDELHTGGLALALTLSRQMTECVVPSREDGEGSHHFMSVRPGERSFDPSRTGVFCATQDDGLRKLNFHRLSLQQFLKNPHPISEKNLFDFFVVESAFDQLGRQISSLAMMQQIGNEVHVRKSLMKLRTLVFRPVPVNEFEEIETDTDAVDADQVYDLGDVIDIAIKCSIFLF